MMLFASSIPILLLLVTTSSGSPIVNSVNNREIRGIWNWPWNNLPVTPFSGSCPVNLESWFCGAHTKQMEISHSIIDSTCPEKMPELNHCCAIHDSCYDNMSYSKEQCDFVFCKCLDTAMSSTPNLPVTCQEFVTDVACKAVELFGGKSYGKWAMPLQSRHYHPALNQTANWEYKNLLAYCIEFAKPISSCAYNHVVCTVKMLPEKRYNQEYTECREKLISCVEDVFEFFKIKKTQEEKCVKQFGIALDAIKDDARDSGMDPSQYYATTNTTTAP